MTTELASIDRMKNQHGHGVCWMSTGRKLTLRTRMLRWRRISYATYIRRHIVTAAAASWYFATYIPVYQVYEIPGININRTQSKILGGTGQPPSLFAGGLVVVTSLLFCYY